MVRIRPLFAWYDFWDGVFIDTRKRRAYILPLACIGFDVEWADIADEMLAALKELDEALTPAGVKNGVPVLRALQRCRAAIANAEGEAK